MEYVAILELYDGTQISLNWIFVAEIVRKVFFNNVFSRCESSMRSTEHRSFLILNHVVNTMKNILFRDEVMRAKPHKEFRVTIIENLPKI